MSVIEGLLIFFAILLLYFIMVFTLHKRGILEKHNISLYGPALLIRTKKGLNFLKKIASKRRFWKAFGSFGVVFCIVFMVLMVLLLVWQAWAVLGFTPEQKEALPGPEIALVLPGINPILPIEYIGYILLALVVAVVVHEFSHGILVFVGKLKVKSLGILYLIVPIGAFCEPDEEELKKAETKKRMRVYAAGPLSNFVVALVSIMLFSFVFMSAVQPVQSAEEGMVVLKVYEDSPVDKAGIGPGAVILSVNDTNFSDFNTFEDRVIKYIEIINKTNANDTITITYSYDDSSPITKEIMLGDRYNYTKNASYMGKGHPGIYSFINIEGDLKILQNPLFEKFPYGFLFFYVIPLTGYFQGYNPIVSPFTDLFKITGPLGVLPPVVFWMIINALYWIFWLNLAVGLFNVLPMVPLDGGFLFNDSVGLSLKRIKKNISDERKEKIVRNISTAVSLLILLAIIFPFIIKYI